MIYFVNDLLKPNTKLSEIWLLLQIIVFFWFHLISALTNHEMWKSFRQKTSNSILYTRDTCLIVFFSFKSDESSIQMLCTDRAARVTLFLLEIFENCQENDVKRHVVWLMNGSNFHLLNICRKYATEYILSEINEKSEPNHYVSI